MRPEGFFPVILLIVLVLVLVLVIGLSLACNFCKGYKHFGILTAYSFLLYSVHMFEPIDLLLEHRKWDVPLPAL
jgi:hypothetical protein